MARAATSFGKDRTAELPWIQWINDKKFKLVGGSPEYATQLEGPDVPLIRGVQRQRSAMSNFRPWNRPGENSPRSLSSTVRS